MKYQNLVLSALTVVALWPTEAYACTPTVCVQNVNFVPVGTLPANMVRLGFVGGSAFPFRPGSDSPPPEPRLYRVEGDSKVSVPFELADDGWITPSETLSAGTILSLEADAPACPYSFGMPSKATYTVGEAKPLPTLLGTVSASLERQIVAWVYPPPDASNCVSRNIDLSYADLRLELDPSAQPYSALFAYAVYVDDVLLQERYHSGPVSKDFRPRGEERVYTVCSSENGETSQVAPGMHAVRFEGTLPDGTKLSTPELSIELRCDGSMPGVPVNGPSPSATDAGNVWDSPAQKPDASYEREDTIEEAPARAEGQGCALVSNHSNLSGAVLALAMLLRRRRSGHQP